MKYNIGEGYKGEVPEFINKPTTKDVIQKILLKQALEDNKRRDRERSKDFQPNVSRN